MNNSPTGESTESAGLNNEPTGELVDNTAEQTQDAISTQETASDDTANQQTQQMKSQVLLVFLMFGEDENTKYIEQEKNHFLFCLLRKRLMNIISLVPAYFIKDRLQLFF